MYLTHEELDLITTRTQAQISHFDRDPERDNKIIAHAIVDAQIAKIKGSSVQEHLDEQAETLSKIKEGFEQLIKSLGLK